jgi:hypothetical protein
MTVIPYVKINQRVSRLSDFLEILYWVFLRKSVEKIQIWLKSVQKCGEIYVKNYVNFIFA